MFKRFTMACLPVALAISTVGCDVDKVEDGELPTVDVDISGDAGQLPDYDVEGPDVDVSMEESEVTVPDIDVKMKEKTIKTPDVDVSLPNDEE